MTLKKYRNKRNFRKTTEPLPGSSARKRKPVFVIQKHDASHLHYDFRIENQGVLKSWAVPKGIPMEPGVKRLAIEVEDHPYEYKDFEGIIPEGSYGAGNVIIWDEGTYSVPGLKKREETEDSVAESLKKGHLELELSGKKLQGAFHLFRIRTGEKNQWMIQRKDPVHSGNMDEKSVRSGKEVEEIGEPEKNKIDLEGLGLEEAPKSVIPFPVEPMLATLIEEPFDGENWAFEIKFDGYRSLAEIKKGKVRLYSRNGQSQNEKFKPVAEAFQNYPLDALFDGEIVVLNSKGVSDFQKLQNYIKKREGQILYYVFDVLYADGRDLRDLPLRLRRKILERILPALKGIRISEQIPKKGKEFFRAAADNDCEGIIAKERDSTYQCGKRSSEWLKIKAFKEQEAIICGVTKPRALRKHFGSLVLGIYKQGKLNYIGHAGSGFDEETLEEIDRRLKPLVQNRCPFEEEPDTARQTTWVKPKLICQVKFQEWTRDGRMRQPVFMGLREDKPALHVVEEKPKALREISVGKALQLGTKARLTHLDKIFWPKEKYRKQDVFDYYYRMAKWMLPYLKDRPQSLKRHPGGIEEKAFFQKEAGPYLPEWIETVQVQSESRGGKIRYILCQNLDTLLYIANLGCIEINVWDSTVEHLDNPDYIVFDFDPLGVAFPQVIQAVLTTRSLLEKVGLQSFCKTSGGRGMHIYIPILADVSYEVVKQFTELIDLLVRQMHPGIISLERNPLSRQGRIYLDFLQNKKGATMVAPYSLRALPGAPVSTPLKWKEVVPGLEPLNFTMRNLQERMEKNGDVWEGFFEKPAELKKSLPALERLILGKGSKKSGKTEIVAGKIEKSRQKKERVPRQLA